MSSALRLGLFRHSETGASVRLRIPQHPSLQPLLVFVIPALPSTAEASHSSFLSLTWMQEPGKGEHMGIFSVVLGDLSNI